VNLEFDRPRAMAEARRDRSTRSQPVPLTCTLSLKSIIETAIIEIAADANIYH
jgi:hypothetical protein